MDESSLTGESACSEKVVVNEQNMMHGADSILLKMTYVQQGHGVAVVVGTGSNTIAGYISEQVFVEHQQTPLQEKLEVLADQIGNFGMAAAVITFLFVVLRIILELVQVIPCGC